MVGDIVTHQNGMMMMTRFIWALYWVGLVAGVLGVSLGLLSSDPWNVWNAVAVPTVLWGGALMAVVLRKFVRSS
jgi:hypothetical protein